MLIYRSIITIFKGNHAQGVALSAQKLGIKAIIVMPVTASEIKVNSVRRLGATVILSGADLEEAKKECLRLAQDNGYVFVPPYDDPYIIAGQGTCGMEIIRQMRRGERLDAIFVPVGGGGLLSGIAAFIKRVAPEIKIIGVNTEDSTSMATSLQRRERTTMPSVGLFSDGTAVRQIGEETYRISANLVDDMVLVTVDEICAAIKDVFEDTRSILEPAGALGVAGIKKFLQGRGKNIQGGVFVAVTSGANMNFDRLRFVSERSRIGEGKECLLSCKVEEKPGSLMRLYSKIFPRSVTEVSYRYSDAIQAQIYVAFELSKGKEEIKSVVESINSDPSMTAIDITDNDLAKSHLRFLVGGRAPKSALGNEKLYRFSFPERPGAFRLFFEQLKNASAGRDLWGLTLFHYRNTGGDMARVLIGMDIPPEAEADGSLQLFLKSLGFSFVEETNNTVYQHFLR
jgi:threonine dehydratase